MNLNDEESLYINGVTVSSMSKYKITIPLTDIPVQNVDGTHNKAGDVRYKTKIRYNIDEKQFEDWFYVTKLGEQ
jgi:hypothetical protein